MGEKLFPLILEVLGEEARNKPFINILNRVEQLEILPSANRCRELIKIRNLLIHMYTLEQELLIKELNEVITVSKELMEIYQNIKERIKPYLKRR